MTSHKSLLNSPGVTRWWLHQRFHLTPDHSSHGSPRSDGQNKPDASEMNLKSESKHTVHLASYHAENGVRAAAALVHLRFSIMPVFCVNQATITWVLQYGGIKNERVSDAMTLLSPLVIQDRACSGDVTISSVRSATYTFFCGQSESYETKLHDKYATKDERLT